MMRKTQSQAALAAILLLAATGPAIAQKSVQLGVDRFASQPPDWAKGKRLGVLTNDGALDSAGTPVADRLSRSTAFQVVAFFAPEHGLAADKQGTIGDSKRNGLPIYSLYGDSKSARKAPTDEQLQTVDLLVCDLPDVGARFYTFASTMSLSMQAAQKAGKRFVVLDRPNPINGEQIEGPILQAPLFSFVGLHPIPIRHGMTMGELARMFNAEATIGCDLQVIAMTGWHRSMWFDQTALPWGRPSPAMKTLDSATVYPGMCLFEATNLDCRVGETAFTTVAAPWLDAKAVAGMLNARHLPGVTFKATEWPQGHGLTLTVTDRQAFQPVKTAWHILHDVRARHGNQLHIEAGGFDRLNGSPLVRERLLAGDSVDHFGDASEQKAFAQFASRRQAYLLYQ